MINMAKDMYQKRKERKEGKVNNGESLQKTSINWYPGHMAKTKRQIIENINLIDIVYEVVDARIPFSSKIKEIDSIVKNKYRILVMNKKDLCNITMTSKWIKYYENLGYNVICLDLKNSNDYQKLITLTEKITSVIQEKRISKGLKKKEIKALVIGIPNVGKSTLINQLANKKVANVANTPGVTKNLNFLPTKYGITLLDTPGILWPKLDNDEIALNIAAIGSIKKQLLNMTDVASHIISKYIENYPDIIKEIYNLDENDVLSIMDCLGKKWGFVKNEEVDYNKVGERIYTDLVSGKVKNITLDICK